MYSVETVMESHLIRLNLLPDRDGLRNFGDRWLGFRLSLREFEGHQRDQ